MKTEEKMRNFKYLCLLFVILTANRVICRPSNEKPILCSIPPDMMLSFGIESNDNFKNCEDDEEIKYCQEIHHLLSDISNCSLGKVWDLKELREKFISSKQMPFDDKIDICFNFGNLMKIIQSANFGEKSAGVQLTRNADICANFCSRQPNVCPLLLKLYWIRNVLMEVTNEFNKPNELLKTLPPEKADSAQPLDQSKTLKKSQTQTAQTNTENLNLGDKDTSNKIGKSEKDDKVSNIKSPATNINLTNTVPKKKLTTIKQTIPSLTDEVTDAKLPTNKNIHEQTTQSEVKPSIDQQTNNDDLLTKTITESESKAKVPVPVPVASKKPTDSNNNDKNVKKEVSKKIDNSPDKKGADELENKLLPDDKPMVQPNPVKENPLESENGLNQESEKTDKGAEFGNQPNEFSEAFADSINDYMDEQQLPPTINAGKVETKVDVNKKFEISLGKDNRIGSGFPEESGHFFAYFLTIIVLCIAGYLVFHNKQKIIALIIEGRHERRRRPNGGYKRLDSKDSSKTTSQVIF